ncbi:N-acetyltransferase [Sinorhizobium meliloti]|uniref:GNAT family N-acetyltransferase n=1 Tax=Rhizobium meliloti TaxID=382 RepID=UPI000FDB97F8|nr:GNAT family N-acetyltransferase [Sinorhizobium meliloti]RVE93154.1 N-acetyltransferase [Sinorhizobium meliloti]RVG12616.1 N-acetyltransferase [Sinorhizobium meliloti]RVH43816.1 N-acetyltransferase [Sinorhizobium meliloti]RVI57106.1 N-acetyltransferase [Sinorhizobium meliloti]RVI75130.1 N-acetyltransferase [Sinorhizobium meliloti]
MPSAAIAIFPARGEKRDRLLLRPPCQADFAEIAEMFSDEIVVRHIGNGPLSRGDAWARFLRDVGHWAIEGFGLFSVIEKASGAYVGKIGYATFERDLGPKAQTRIEMSWTLRSQFHGMGFAIEGASAAQQWFDSGHRKRTACLIAAANLSSIKLATRLGYMEVDRTYRGNGAVVVLARDAIAF